MIYLIWRMQAFGLHPLGVDKVNTLRKNEFFIFFELHHFPVAFGDGRKMISEAATWAAPRGVHAAAAD